jgi:hypothetical protein
MNGGFNVIKCCTKFIFVFLLATSSIFVFRPAIAGSLPEFTSQAQAQQHCPVDTVVWLNTKSDVYHYQGSRWYGDTKHGAYVCEREAIAAGMRASKNG